MKAGEKDQITEQLASVLKEIAPDSCFVQNYFSIPFPEEPKICLPNPPIEVAKATHPDDFEDFLNDIQLSETEIKDLAKGTVGQSDSEDWHKQRLGRITASKFHAVSITMDKIDKSNSNNSRIQNLCREIMGYSHFVQTKAMKHGISEEYTAKKKYSKFMRSSKQHKGFECEDTGLHVIASHPYIGASPDMIISCECHGPGVVEIKCPYSICEQTPTPQNYTHMDDKGKLCRSSPYFAQVQGQMAVLSVKYCDFFVYTKHGFLMDRVNFDNTYWNNLLVKLERFWKQFIAPEMLTGKIHTSIEVPKKMIELDHVYATDNTNQKTPKPKTSKPGPLQKPVLPQVFLCPTCGEECSITPKSKEEQSVLCNLCNNWEHLHCGGLRSEAEAQSNIFWLCQKCKSA